MLVTRQNKILSAAIALCMAAFFTMSSSPTASAGSPTLVPVTITATYTFAGFPNVVGTFTTSGGGLGAISGTTTMNVGLIGPNGLVAHCVVTLIAPLGTIVIDQQCQFATSMPAPYPTGQGKGRWEIVGGTGIYANLFGNGSLTMPTTTQGDPQEAMTGYIYQ